MAGPSDRRSPGFTLVELLVVVSIIALLLAMLLPALGAARVLAKDVVCMTNTRQQAIAVSSYINDFDGFMPAYRIKADTGNLPTPNPWNDQVGEWSIHIWDVLNAYIPAEHDLRTGSQRQVWFCPTYDSRAGTTGGYGQNISDLNASRYIRTFTFGGKSGTMRTFKMDALEYPSDYILTGDAPMYNNFNWGASQILWWDGAGKASTGGYRHTLDGEENSRDHLPKEDFKGKSNYGFADGHADSLHSDPISAPERLFRQKPQP